MARLERLREREEDASDALLRGSRRLDSRMNIDIAQRLMLRLAENDARGAARVAGEMLARGLAAARHGV